VNRFLVTLALAGALAGPPALAEGPYRWVDDEGTVHYTQRLPEGRTAEIVRLPAWAFDPPAPEIRAGGPHATMAAERQEQAELVRKNCEIARENKRILESQELIVQERDKDGNLQPLDETAKAARLSEAEKHIKEFCGG
jgi:hypothetical protein